MTSQGRAALAPLTNSSQGRQSMIPGPRKSIAPSARAAPANEKRMSVAPSSQVEGRPSTSSQGRLSTLGRQSGAGVRRSSMYGKQAAPGSKKDPRPVSDKQYMGQCVRKVILYLTSHGYDQEINPKLLISPTAKQFFSILQFLVRFVDPSFTITKEKFEEEVPNMFKALKYPFTISPKSLLSVGTPHTWPNLLAALTWLVELISYQEAVEESSNDLMSDKESDAFLNDDQFFLFTSKAYNEWLKGSSQFEEVEAQLETINETHCAKLKQAIDKMNEQKRALQQEITMRTNQPNPVVELETKLAACNSDLGKFKQLITNLNDHMAKVQQIVEDQKAELEAKQNELKAAQKEKELLQHTVDTQPMSAADVEKLTAERVALEEQLAATRALVEENERIVFDKEITISKKVEEFEKAVQAYGTQARKLKLVPSNAKYAKGIEFQIQFNPHNPDAIVDQIRGTIKPELEKLKMDVARSVIEAKNETLTIQEQIERLDEQISNKKDDIEALDSKYKKLEAAYLKEKQTLDEQVRTVSSESESMAAEIARLREASQDAVARSQKSLDAIRREYEEVQASASREKAEMQNIILSSMELLASHKAHIHSNLEALLKYYVKVKNEATTQSVGAPTLIKPEPEAQ
eukprot:TRINITY_DN23011_c0_g1_i1.p1 TRINITY_DN23011_c0_g1~~TRINITY_DN23011_c0_g1_i1.p1  ORF type:complete len:634 (-),score=285.00 TRINITY_DN23011_c0_g1_i1:320-2221(-)